MITDIFYADQRKLIPQHYEKQPNEKNIQQVHLTKDDTCTKS